MFQILGNPPFFTFSIFVVCVIFFLFRPNILATCLIPTLVFSPNQLPRLFLYAFEHTGFFHLFLNMLAWMTMAKDFEHTVGSLPAAYTILILILPCNTFIQTISSFVFDFVFRTGFRNTCCVGISGVLFSILVVNLRLSGQSHASFFGFLPMPISIYPFVLAGLIQLLLPGASLVGHCAGILSGLALAKGWFRIVTPSDDRFDAIETKFRLTRLPAWQPVPSMFGHLFENLADHLLPGRGGSPPPSLRERTANAWRSISTWFSPSNGSQQNRQQDQRDSSSNQESDSATRGGVYMTGSGSTSVPSDSVFTGAGYALGSSSAEQTQSRLPPTSRSISSAEQPQGRVPPNSRLLMLEGQRTSTSRLQNGYGATKSDNDKDFTR